MGRQTHNKKRGSGIGRVLALPALGVALLVAIVAGSILNRPDQPEATVPATQPTLPPNPYTAQDFVQRDGYLSCTAGDALLGVDVSEHQQQVDWQQVADAGMKFAFVRLGYRGYTEGGMYTDQYAAANLTGAKDAGLQVGAYFYSQAVTVEEAREEARFCVDFLKDHKIDLPVVFDWEFVSADARTGQMDRTTLTDCAIAFCQTVEQAGYDAMVYFNPHIAESFLDLLALEDYGFWLSQYDTGMDFPHRVDFWQYTCTGSVPGISGDADINLWFVE